MSERLIVVAIASALGACGDNEPPAGEIRSGARIRATYFETAEGDRIHRGWFDRELGVDCAWSGDPPRCLPAHMTTTVYRNAACTEPVVEALPRDGCGDPAPDYVGAPRDPCDDAVDQLWRIGGAIAIDTVYGFDPRTDTCSPRPADPATYRYYAAGERVALETFVGGRVELLGRGRVRSRTIVGDDGALVPIGGVDTELGAGCRFDLEPVCYPEASYAWHAIDDACEVPVATAPAGCAPPAVIANNRVDPPALYARGELVTDDPEEVLRLYDMSILVAGEGWSCAPFVGSVLPGFAMYRAGAPIASDGLVPVEEVVGEGARIAPEWLVAGGHRELAGHRDLALDQGCVPTEVSPDTWRCTPRSPSYVVWTYFYGDPDCTEVLPLTFEYGDESSGQPTFSRDQDDPCGWPLRAYELGAVRPPGTYFVPRPQGCEPYVFADNTDLRAYEVGPETSLESYAALTPVVE